MSATDIMDAYHTLWKIEESFRVMKSTLEVRPVFHWSKKRIEGHFVVCFLAFLMERKMELLLKGLDDECTASPEKIRGALNSMQHGACVRTGESECPVASVSDHRRKGVCGDLRQALRGIHSPRCCCCAVLLFWGGVLGVCLALFCVVFGCRRRVSLAVPRQITLSGDIVK